MKKFRKTICALAAGAILLASAPVMAKDITVVLNGIELSFDQPPIIVNGATMVPVRGIFEALGYNITWDDTTGLVFAINSDRLITVGVGMRAMLVKPNNVELTENTSMDEMMRYGVDLAPYNPIIVNDRVLVPVRAITEGLGAQVAWDGETQTVTITASY